MKVYTDNQNVVRIACKGSMNVELQQLAMQIFGICVACSIQLELEWIPRDLNYLADEYSKIFDFDDWSVADEIFRLFDAGWGSFTCDIFANCKKFKVMQFYSKFWNPGASGVDVFAYLGGRKLLDCPTALVSLQSTQTYGNMQSLRNFSSSKVEIGFILAYVVGCRQRVI